MSRPEWGLLLTVEQAWESLGTTLGEPVGAVTLAPGEDLDVQVFGWHRSRTNVESEQTEIVDRQTTTQLTTHDSYQVNRRIESEFHWGVSGESSKAAGAAGATSSALSFNAGGSVKNTVERQLNHTRDLTVRVAEQMRTERKVRIATTEEVGREERRQQRLKNPNRCHSVTFQFYEQLNHHLVRHAPAELTWVVLIPNELPALTAAWVTCHEKLLREHLLDDSMADGIHAARRIASQGSSVQLEVAANLLLRTFTARITPLPSGGGASVVDLVGQTLGLGLKALGSIFGFGGSGGGAPPPNLLRALRIPNTHAAVRGFLVAQAEHPTVEGLAVAGALVARHYVDETAPESVTSALAYLASVLASAGLRSVPGENAEADALAAGAGEREEQELAAHAEARAAFARLVCHLEDNLLHYMRAIWRAEDPARRWTRFGSQTLGGEAFWELVENRLLGFHLNASVFPVRLGAELEARLNQLVAVDELAALPEVPAPAGLATYKGGIQAWAKRSRGKLAAGIATHIEAQIPAAQELVSRAVERALANHAGGEPFAMAKDVLAKAQGQLEHLRPKLTAGQQATASAVEAALGAAERTTIAEPALRAHLSELVFAARALSSGLAPVEDLYVTLPSGGAHVEPLRGQCSGCGPLEEREAEAQAGLLESRRRAADADADRRRRRVDSGDLAPEPDAAPLRVEIEKPEP
ncbi:MAG: hypothetical protein IT370_09055 [Deltaproteobacteria bacterium]|nr:hypothetical protein [Deltaproteobacteria bacterium]